MGVTDKEKAKALREKRKKEKELQEIVQSQVSADFHSMLDEFHRMNVKNDYKLDTKILQWRIEEMTDGQDNLRGTWDNSLPTFSPSGAGSSDRELFLKAIDAEEDEEQFEPYQKRWVRNGSAIHEAMQRDLLYIEKYLPDSPFEVCRTREGKPAWERNTRTVKQFEHNGERFQIYGMVDGMLFYKPRKKRIGYDFKTKSTTVAAVGDYKLKVPQENNVAQMVAYSLLFDVDEYIIHYESLAKDGWTKGKEAKPDMKVFHIQITDEMKTEVLDKFARVARSIRLKQLPDRETDNEMFSKYTTLNEAIEKLIEENEPITAIPTKKGEWFELGVLE